MILRAHRQSYRLRGIHTRGFSLSHSILDYNSDTYNNKSGYLSVFYTKYNTTIFVLKPQYK